MKAPTPEETEAFLKTNPFPPLNKQETDYVYDAFYNAMVTFYEKNPEEDKKVKRHNRYIKNKASKKKTSRG